MKRLLSLILCAVAAVSFCACEKKEEPASTEAVASSTEVAETTAPAATRDETLTSSTEKSDTEKLKDFVRSFDKTTTIEKHVIFENDHLSVTADKIEYTATGPKLNISAVSSYDKDVRVQSSYVDINGKMVRTKLDTVVPAGKTAKGDMAFLYFDLAISNITQMQTIEFPLVINDDANKPIEKTDLISVGTSAQPKEKEAKPEFHESGQTVLDRDDVKIVIKGLNTDHTYDADKKLTDKLVVSMYNGTDHNISVRAEDVQVNGCKVTPVMNFMVYPGKQATYYVAIYDLDLEECGVRNIDSIKVIFSVKNMDNGEKFNTEQINVDLSQKDTINIATPDSVSTRKYEH